LLNTGVCYVPYVDPCLNKPYIVTTTGVCIAACDGGYYLDGILCK